MERSFRECLWVALTIFVFISTLSVIHLTFLIDGSVKVATDTLASSAENLNVQLATLNNTAQITSARILNQTDTIGQYAGELSKNATTLVSSANKATLQLTQTLDQVSLLANSLQSTSIQLNSTFSNANGLIADSDKFVTDPSLTKLPRSTRALVDELALTASHVRATANTINEGAPEMVKSANSIAASAAGVTSDVHQITTDITKPKPWYKQIGAYLGDAVKIGGVIF